MDNDKKFLVENNLIKAIQTFHDCDEKERRESYVREYFIRFCKENDVNEEEALKMLEDFFDYKRENTMFKYEYYEDLRSIIYPNSIKDMDDGDYR